jgi:hypothetical protein
VNESHDLAKASARRLRLPEADIPGHAAVTSNVRQARRSPVCHSLIGRVRRLVRDHNWKLAANVLRALWG